MQINQTKATNQSNFISESSKTPPCILRKNAKQAEKNLKDIVELTEREKLYTPNVVSTYLKHVQTRFPNTHSYKYSFFLRQEEKSSTISL